MLNPKPDLPKGAIMIKRNEIFAEKLKGILTNLALTTLAIHLSIVGAWFFYIMLLVDTTQPLQDYDTLSSFFATFYKSFAYLLKVVVDFLFGITHN